MLRLVVTLLLPLLESAAFTLVFTLFVRPQVTPTTYFVFVYIGVVAWRAFAGSVTSATREGGATTALLRARHDALFAAPLVLAAVVLVRGIPPLAALIVWLPIGIGLQFAATLGLGGLVAAAAASDRDRGTVVGPLLSVLMFAAPVVYPTSLVPVAVRLPFLANPMATAIEAYRAALLGGVPPAPAAVALATVVAGALLVAGWTLVRRSFQIARPSGSC